MARLPRRSSGDDLEGEDSMMSEAFLGTLRSELDEDIPLEGAFAELHARYASLRESYLAGRMDPRVFGRALRDLRVVDLDGYQWTVGATTGRWYRRNVAEGEKWMAAPSPVGTGTLVDHAGQAAGWAVENWDERRRKRLEAEAAKAEAAAAERSEDSENRSRMSIDDMFDKYVEAAEEASEYSIDEMILAIDDVPESDWRDPSSSE